MDNDHFLISLITLLSLTKIRLSTGLILPELEPASNYNIGVWPFAYYHWPTIHFLTSGSRSDPQKHYFMTAQCKHALGSGDAFVLTSF